eukprot:m51a1_g13977 hypothetical protein (285) ;mRNA; f:1003927-1005534
MRATCVLALLICLGSSLGPTCQAEMCDHLDPAACVLDPSCSWSMGECRLDLCGERLNVGACESDRLCSWSLGDSPTCSSTCGRFKCVSSAIGCSWNPYSESCMSDPCSAIVDRELCKGGEGVAGDHNIWDSHRCGKAAGCFWDSEMSLCLFDWECSVLASEASCQWKPRRCTWDAPTSTCIRRCALYNAESSAQSYNDQENESEEESENESSEHDLHEKSEGWKSKKQRMVLWWSSVWRNHTVAISSALGILSAFSLALVVAVVGWKVCNQPARLTGYTEIPGP